MTLQIINMIHLLYIILQAEVQSASILVQYGALGVLTLGSIWMYFNERKERLKIQTSSDLRIQQIQEQRDKTIKDIQEQRDASIKLIQEQKDVLNHIILENKKEYEDTLKNIFQELKNL